VRLVEIEEVDLNTCGGTHVANLAEIGCVKLLGVEPLRGGSRWHWVAGGRVRRRLAAHERRNARLRSLLDGGDDDLLELAARTLAQAAELRRGLERAEERLAELEAAELAAAADGPRAAAEAHIPAADSAFLQQVARHFAARRPEGLLLLTGGSGERGCFAVVAGVESRVDLPQLGAAVAALLAGRGGGRAPVFQGRAESFERRDEAVRRLREAASADGPDA
jgi:alanyl-tRNA synthetase